MGCERPGTVEREGTACRAPGSDRRNSRVPPGDGRARGLHPKRCTEHPGSKALRNLSTLAHSECGKAVRRAGGYPEGFHGEAHRAWVRPRETTRGIWWLGIGLSADIQDELDIPSPTSPGPRHGPEPEPDPPSTAEPEPPEPPSDSTPAPGDDAYPDWIQRACFEENTITSEEASRLYEQHCEIVAERDGTVRWVGSLVSSVVASPGW